MKCLQRHSPRLGYLAPKNGKKKALCDRRRRRRKGGESGGERRQESRGKHLHTAPGGEKHERIHAADAKFTRAQKKIRKKNRFRPIERGPGQPKESKGCRAAGKLTGTFPRNIKTARNVAMRDLNRRDGGPFPRISKAKRLLQIPRKLSSQIVI